MLLLVVRSFALLIFRQLPLFLWASLLIELVFSSVAANTIFSLPFCSILITVACLVDFDEPPARFAPPTEAGKNFTSILP